MKLGVSQSLVHSDTGQNYYIRLGQVSCATVAVSSRAPSKSAWAAAGTVGLGRHAGLEQCPAETIEVDCCYEFFGTFGQWLGGGGGVVAAVAAAVAEHFNGGAGRGGRRSADRGDSSGAVRGGFSDSFHRQSVPLFV